MGISVTFRQNYWSCGEGLRGTCCERPDQQPEGKVHTSITFSPVSSCLTSFAETAFMPAEQPGRTGKERISCILEEAFTK